MSHSIVSGTGTTQRLLGLYIDLLAINKHLMVFAVNFIFSLRCRCRQWVQNSRRADLLRKTAECLNNSCVLCGEHFTNDQFMNQMKNKLIFNAVPTLFDVPNPAIMSRPSKRPAPKERNYVITRTNRKILKVKHL